LRKKERTLRLPRENVARECILECLERLARTEGKLGEETSVGIVVVHEKFRNFKT